MGTTVTPPDNFALVSKGVYRSSFPTKKNFTFVSRLGLRSVLYLCPEDYPESHLAFYAQHGIQLLQFGTTGNKEPFDEIPETIIREALLVILDEEKQPLLIHCNQGKHRTGCLVGCLRKTQRWSLVSIFEEYRRFAGIKSRVHDEQYIERFPVSLYAWPASMSSLCCLHLGSVAEKSLCSYHCIAPYCSAPVFDFLYSPHTLFLSPEPTRLESLLLG